MSALDWLFKLHLIAEQNDILRASGHSNCIRKRYLACFVNKKKIENAYPLRQAEKPCRASDHAIRISGERVLVAFNVLKGGVVRKQGTFCFAAYLYPTQTPTIFTNRLAAGDEQVNNC